MVRFASVVDLCRWEVWSVGHTCVICSGGFLSDEEGIRVILPLTYTSHVTSHPHDTQPQERPRRRSSTPFSHLLPPPPAFYCPTSESSYIHPSQYGDVRDIFGQVLTHTSAPAQHRPSMTPRSEQWQHSASATATASATVCPSSQQSWQAHQLRSVQAPRAVARGVRHGREGSGTSAACASGAGGSAAGACICWASGG